MKIKILNTNIMKKIIIIAVLVLGVTLSANAQKKIEITELPKPAQSF